MWQDEVVRWRWQTTIAAALTLLALGAATWLLTAGGKPARDPARARLAAAQGGDPPSPSDPSTVYATVDQGPSGTPLPAGFLGLSLEYTALDAYTGANAASVDPVFVQLLRNLASPAGQPLVLRVGGDSTDATWWPVAGLTPPAGVRYALTPAWLASARALAGAVPAKLILGLNLAANRPRLSAAEASALLSGIGPDDVDAFELGNEPDVYGVFPWYTTSHGAVYARHAGYGLSSYISEVRRWDAGLPDLPLAGPAAAELPWLSGIPALLDAAPRLRIVTVHRYALQGCFTNPNSPSYPSVANLLSDRSSAGLAAALAPYVALAHSRGLQFRVDELNSAAQAQCLGRTGVSDTFASALWMLDTLFDLASVGVDGVNVHSLPGAGYELFTFSRASTGGWQAFVHPDYYGMLMFSQAFPAGARLVPVSAPAGPVKVWATLAPDGRTRVALINKDSRPHRVELQLPPTTAPAELEWLRAPNATATSGVTLGSQTFGLETTSGQLAAPSLQPVSQLLGAYSIELPAYSAALLTR
ncbi:MAG: glycosyl hydrolase family 79 C-terminal domain-containing protein [Solirubrobacteraceae bacterium]